MRTRWGLGGARRPWLFELLLVMALCACDAVSDDGALYAGGQGGGDLDPCGGEPVTTPIGWTDAVEIHGESGDPVEGTPAALLGPLAGECSAPITWDASGFDPQSATPPGDSEMQVHVTLDEDSVRRVERTPRRAGDEVTCAVFLEADATVSLATADGTFADEGEATLTFTSTSAQPMQLTFALDASMGSFSVDVDAGERAELVYEVGGAGPECAGRIQLMVSGSSGSMGFASAGEIASWSNTGCPLGSEPVALDETDGPLERVEALWSDVRIPAVWDDGEETELQVEVTSSVDSACDDGGGASFPVEVRYGTSDGRIEMHSTEGTVNAFDGFQLWVSDELACASEDDTLVYTRADCSVVESVTLQFGLHGDSQSATEGLEIYENLRDEGDAEPPNQFLDYR